MHLVIAIGVVGVSLGSLIVAFIMSKRDSQ